MTPPGGLFSRAVPFVKHRVFHVHRLIPNASSLRETVLESCPARMCSLGLNREEARRPSSFLMSREPYIPGATTIGMVCKDGVLLASERRYAYGSFVMSKSAKKVFRITDKIGVACAGIVGDMQVLAREARAWMSIYQYEREREATVKNTAKLIANLLSSRRMFPYLAETIIAGLSDGKPELYVLDPIGSVLPDKFAVVGTGAQIAIGVLELDYNDELSVNEGEPLLLRAVKSAIARDISSGDGVDLMIITEQGISEETPRFS